MDKNWWVYDLEVYPNVFTAAFEHAVAPIKVAFEISDHRNDSDKLMEFLNYLHSQFATLVGYNNVGFDYSILHLFIKMGRSDAATLYQKCQAIIGSQDNSERFAHRVRPSDCFLPQIDLFLLNHFDNNARATSLKVLEFNMRSESIEDLPFPVGTHLNREQIEILKRYNAHDVSQTKKFMYLCADSIRFRQELTEKLQQDFMNANDTAIGKRFFVLELEKAGVSCYDYSPQKGRTPRQTPRPVIHLHDCILPWIQFEQPEFQRVLDWLKAQSITETKDALKESYEAVVKGQTVIKTRPVVAKVGGLDFIFGTGGIHASLDSTVVTADDEHMILDLDVTSYYPNLAIQNGLYPEHLGQTFVHIYKTLFEQRKSYSKKSAESAMLKLALNGVYGDSNNQFSVFYDPLFTMRITLNGQLLLCLLAERLLRVEGLQILQVNTDGLTVKVPRLCVPILWGICEQWQHQTRLNLESAEYTRLNIRDVNSYLAVRTDGSVKRKGAYEYKMAWHQDHSALVVPKVAEKVLVEGAPIRQTVKEWPDLMDFMLRLKVPKSSYLQWGEMPEPPEDDDGKVLPWPQPTENLIQNTTRYLVTVNGKPLRKWMPPTPKMLKENNPSWRPIGIESGWNVTVCNRLENPDELRRWIDYDYYVNAVEKLVMGLK